MAVYRGGGISSTYFLNGGLVTNAQRHGCLLPTYTLEGVFRPNAKTRQGWLGTNVNGDGWIVPKFQNQAKLTWDKWLWWWWNCAEFFCAFHAGYPVVTNRNIAFGTTTPSPFLFVPIPPGSWVIYCCLISTISIFCCLNSTISISICPISTMLKIICPKSTMHIFCNSALFHHHHCLLLQFHLGHKLLS